MSDVFSSSAPAPTGSATRVAPTPVSPGETGQQQTPAQFSGNHAPADHADHFDTAVTLAPSLAGYAEGEQIALEVLTRDSAGRQILQASNAVFVTVDPATLSDDAAIRVRVVSLANDQVRVALLTANGDEPDAARYLALRLVQVSFDAAPAPPPAPSKPSAGTDVATATKTPPGTLALNAIVGAQMLAAANDGAAVPTVNAAPDAMPARATSTASALPLTVGTILPLRIIGVAPPLQRAVGPTSTVSVSSVGVTAGGAAPTQAPGLAASAAHPTNPPSGAVTPAVTAAKPPPGATPPPSAPQLNGVIVTSPRPDQTVVATPTGTVVLSGAAPKDWIEGTRIALETVSEAVPANAARAGLLPAAAAAAPPAVTAASTEQFLLRLGDGWPALRELTTHVAASSPVTAEAFNQARIPATGARAAAQILFFLSVLRSGDIAGWLGNDIVRVLERTGQRGLMERLGDDFRQLRRLGDDGGAADWRLLLFPFSDGERVEPVRMFVRGQKRQGHGGDLDARFIVDLNLSALGTIQLDGLLRGRTFDLIVRSHEALDDVRRQSISQIFTSGLESIGYRGALSFQTTREFPVQPFNELLGVQHTPGAVLA